MEKIDHQVLGMGVGATIVQETCRRLHAKGTYLTSNALVENAEYCRHLMFETLVGPEELENVKRQGAVGDILGHCFDKAGKFVQTELEDRLVSIPVSSLMQIEERYGVAGGVHKVGAIRGALNSGLIKTPITDEKTASQLVEGFSGERAQTAKERR